MNTKLMYVLPLLGSLVAGCVERTTKMYQVGNISVTRETEDGREKVSFYSGCHFVSSDKLGGKYEIKVGDSIDHNCQNKPQVPEVEALFKRLESYQNH